MTRLATTDEERRQARRTAIAGGVLGVLGGVAAFLFKARCGLPPSEADAYLRWCYTDVLPLWFAERLDVGAVPYLDHAVEYPPLTGAWMWLAALPADGPVSFLVWTSVLLVVAAGVTGALLASTVGLGRTLVFAAAPTLLVSGVVNWDLPSVALATAGLVAHRRGRDGWAGVWLGLGTAAKLWPALLLPAIVLAAAVQRGREAGWRAAGGAVGAWLVVNVPVMVAAPAAWSRFLTLNRDRAADWDSLWRIVGGWVGVDLGVPTVNALGALVTLAGCATLLVLALRWDRPQHWHLVALPVVAWFLVVGKVYSPQFTLWLLPLLALATPPVWALLVFFAADVAVTLTRFPHLAEVAAIEGGAPAWPFEVAVVSRAVGLLIVAVWGWRRAAAPPPADRHVLRITPPRTVAR